MSKRGDQAAKQESADSTRDDTNMSDAKDTTTSGPKGVKDESDHGHLYESIVSFLPQELLSVRSAASYCPLIAAIMAPMSTLMDIPALAQHWYSYYGVRKPDPPACLVLSGVGLGLNVVANILLVIRFSATKGFVTKGTKSSLACWMGKTIVAVINLAIFGASTNNGPGFKYDEAFWCAVVSVIMSGIISAALLFHYIFAFGHPGFDKDEYRLEGRKFMISVTTFMVLLAFQGLAFNRIEHWTYLDSIYFSMQTALTIGYGDLVPTTAAGKVLVFPFSVLTISQLANEVSIIIDFIKNRAKEKRDRRRKKYALMMHAEALKRQPYSSLIDEMSLIHQINLRQESLTQLIDLFWSALALLSFWLIGAAIFHSIEGWGYGNGVYAVMVLSLTIGFGDFTPVEPAGRVVWVIYALMAVPIVTSFAVATVTGIMYTWQEHRFTRARFDLERRSDPEVFAPHSHFIFKHHEHWAALRKEYLDLISEMSESSEGNTRETTEIAASTDSTELESDLGVQEAAWLVDKMNREDEQDGTSASPSVAPSETGEAGEGGNSGVEGAEEEIVTVMLEDPACADPVVEALGGPDLKGVQSPGAGAPNGAGSQGRGGPVVVVPPGLVDAHRKDSRSSSNGPDSPVTLRGSQVKSTDKAKGLKKSSSGKDINCQNRSKARRQIEIKLVRQLVDRALRLEAQSRQMLIDTMDKDLARTLLLADRNLQIRDAFQLYSDGIDIQSAYRDEAEKTLTDRAAREEQKKKRQEKAQQMQQARLHLLDLADDDQEDDMLSRVRRYRSTFAEVLVLSSTLLQLEGDDLRRFERWHGSDLHRTARSRKQDGQGQGKAEDPGFGSLGSGTVQKLHGRWKARRKRAKPAKKGDGKKWDMIGGGPLGPGGPDGGGSNGDNGTASVPHGTGTTAAHVHYGNTDPDSHTHAQRSSLSSHRMSLRRLSSPVFYNGALVRPGGQDSEWEEDDCPHQETDRDRDLSTPLVPPAPYDIETHASDAPTRQSERHARTHTNTHHSQTQTGQIGQTHTQAQAHPQRHTQSQPQPRQTNQPHQSETQPQIPKTANSAITTNPTNSPAPNSANPPNSKVDTFLNSMHRPATDLSAIHNPMNEPGAKGRWWRDEATKLADGVKEEEQFIASKLGSGPESRGGD